MSEQRSRLVLSPKLDYHQLFRSLPGSYLLFGADDPDFTIVDVSDFHAKMAMSTQEAMVGRKFFDLFPDTSAESKKTGVSHLATVFREVIRTKQSIVVDTFRHDIGIKNKKSVRYWEPTYHPIFDSQGVVTHILQISRDITKEVSVARNAKGSAAQLDATLAVKKIGSGSHDVQQDVVAADKQTKDEFIALASHELRTPASAVKQYLGMLLDGFAGPIPPEHLPFLHTAYDSNERQIKIINDILLVAQLDLNKLTMHKEPLDICEMVAEIIHDVPRLSNRGSLVQFACPIKSAMISADPGYLRMALSNIAENAAKYTPDDKPITIDVQSTDTTVTIRVRDEGVGIAPEDMDKLFKKFSRIQNPLSVEVGGTGLGLYWAHEVVKQHRGSVAVESKIGQGSTFVVTIPRLA